MEYRPQGGGGSYGTVARTDPSDTAPTPSAPAGLAHGYGRGQVYDTSSPIYGGNGSGSGQLIGDHVPHTTDHQHWIAHDGREQRDSSLLEHHRERTSRRQSRPLDGYSGEQYT